MQKSLLFGLLVMSGGCLAMEADDISYRNPNPYERHSELATLGARLARADMQENNTRSEYDEWQQRYNGVNRRNTQPLHYGTRVKAMKKSQADATRN